MEEWDDDEGSPTANQGEFIIAKHRNGGLDNIRLKFLGHLGKFDNLDDFSTPFEIASSMNQDDTNPFDTSNLPSADEAFGSSFNNDPDENGVPF